MLAALLLLGDGPATDQTITRLGWFDTPTPGNASLFDGRDEWTIAMQGTPPVPGDWPRFGPGQRVSHGIGSYGFGCARMTLRTDGDEVLAIVSARALPLRTCRAVKKLRLVERKLR